MSNESGASRTSVLGDRDVTLEARRLAQCLEQALLVILVGCRSRFRACRSRS